MRGQFIFFFDPGTYREEDRIPLATGESRESAMQRGIPRLLIVSAEGGVMGLATSMGITVEQPRLTAAEFANLGATLDTFFAEQGVG